ncbi:MAG: branched-chain amino acid transport system II carrier protein, partial [Flavobacteriaceae bacterium]
PFFNSSSLLTSLVYFLLVFIFVMNRGKILNVIGKYLTPAILLVLLGIISVTVFNFPFDFGDSEFPNPISSGILEGYQTFDAIGAIVVGGVIIVSINIKEGRIPYEIKRKIISRAGWLAGLGLFLVYSSLILTGALFDGQFAPDISRTALLNGISKVTLGNSANLFLSILVSLACFTTAVGIVAGTADFVKSRFKNYRNAYLITAVVSCLLGIIMGQFNVAYIIAVAIPALMFIYPITIVLILLNAIPSRFASQLIFRAVIITTIVFSIPDFLESLGMEFFLKSWIPLSEFRMGWLFPALLVFIFFNTLKMIKEAAQTDS